MRDIIRDATEARFSRLRANKIILFPEKINTTAAELVWENVRCACSLLSNDYNWMGQLM